MPSLGHEILRVLERWSESYRCKLRQQFAELEAIVSDEGRLDRMKRFARAACVDWDLAPHQLRRLYAWTFVRHRLGNMLFVKEQFKHCSLDMTQLYTANPSQDEGLYDERLEELRSQKEDVIQQWLQRNEPLAGGAGKKIMKLHAHDFPSRKALIEETANKLNIRSTGHGWCLAQDEGRSGQCLYDRTLCSDCHNSVIDASFAPVWQEI